MIPTVNHGKGFRGILNYALDKEGAYLVGPVQGEREELIHAFGVVRQKNSRIEKPVFHMSLSLHPSEHLTDKQWVEVSEKMMERLGYDRNLFVIVRHTDEPHEHVHIIGSRIRSDTYKVVNDFREKLRASAIASELEAEYDLIRAALASPELRHGEGRSQGETGMTRAGKRPIKPQMRERIELAMHHCPSMGAFVTRLACMDVGVRANIGQDHVSGMSFELNGFVIKGSKLGKRFGWGALKKKIPFDPANDLPVLRQANDQFGQKRKARARLTRRGPKTAGGNAALQRHRIQQSLQRARARRHRPWPRPSPSNYAETLKQLGIAARRMHNSPFYGYHDEDEKDQKRERDPRRKA